MMKKIAALAMAAALTFSCIPAEAESLSGVDVNEDGRINVTDLSLFAAYLKGIRALYTDVIEKCDLNGDGVRNVTDLSIMAAYVKGGVKGPSDKELADELARLVNKERRERGISPYIYSPELSGAASRRAEEISRCYDHTRPNGSNCFSVLGEFGITPPDEGGQYASENICYGQSTSSLAFSAFMDSQYHRDSMLDPYKTYMGIGFYRASDGTCYWVQLFVNGNGMSGSEV